MSEDNPVVGKSQFLTVSNIPAESNVAEEENISSMDNLNLSQTSINNLCNTINRKINEKINKIEKENDKTSFNLGPVTPPKPKKDLSNSRSISSTSINANNRSKSPNIKIKNKVTLNTSLNNSSIYSKSVKEVAKTSRSKTPSKRSEIEIKETVESMITRFKEKQNSTLRKIELMKQRLEAEELANIKQVPEINKNLTFKGNKEEFLKRNEMYKHNSENKKRNLIEKELGRRMEETRLNPRLNKKLDQAVLDDKIKSMMEWENSRKAKINLKKEEELMQEGLSCTFKPKINNNSIKLIQAQQEFSGMKKEKFAERLFKNDTCDKKHRVVYEDLGNLYMNVMTNHAPILNISESNVNLKIDEKLLTKENKISESVDNSRENISIDSSKISRGAKVVINNVNNININNNYNRPVSPNLAKVAPLKSNGVINVNSKVIDKISEKESKIIEDLLKQRMKTPAK